MVEGRDLEPAWVDVMKGRNSGRDEWSGRVVGTSGRDGRSERVSWLGERGGRNRMDPR